MSLWATVFDQRGLGEARGHGAIMAMDGTGPTGILVVMGAPLARGGKSLRAWIALPSTKRMQRWMTERSAFFLLSFVCVAHLGSPVEAQAVSPRLTSVADAIEMTRIQYRTGSKNEAIVLSPDLRHAAIVTWRGDIETNRNLYSLSLVDILNDQPPKNLVTLEFTGDPTDQLATPISDVTFVGDGRRIAFLGRERGGLAQVYIVNTMTGRLRRLTNHPTSVRSFIVAPDGSLRAFSAAGQPDVAAIDARLSEDGVFVANRSELPFAHPAFTANAPLVWRNAHAHREYFVAGRPTFFFDSRLSRSLTHSEDQPKTLEFDFMLKSFAQFSGDSSGRHAVLYPYARASHPMFPERYEYYRGRSLQERQSAAPYGLVDLSTGKVDLLLDAPSPTFATNGGFAFWSPDSRSIVLFTLNPAKPDQAPAWVELGLASRRTIPIAAPEGWSAVGFLESGQAIVLQKGMEFASVRRTSNGQWGEFRAIGSATQFNDRWKIATNGRFAVGVKDALRIAPEVASLNLETGTATTLTNLNSWLRDRLLGEVEELGSDFDDELHSAGFLIKPVGYIRGSRYPLVYLFDDGTLGRDRAPFLLDAAGQLNGHAIQMLAAQGFMVFYSRDPPMKDVVGTRGEGPLVTRHVESVLSDLDRRGLIDPHRIGISGWSRAGYYTNFALIHSHIRFAAASAMDGGSREYNDNVRPFSDTELAKIKAPLLYEAYGIRSLVGWGSMADRLFANGQPFETIYYEASPHSTVRPKHRLRSLQTHIDWWRFWLKGEEDPTTLSADQYPRWREMKRSQCARLTGDDRPWYCEQK